jgi:hypothetical protein
MSVPYKAAYPELPPCSIGDCENAAAAVIDSKLLCAEHAIGELERRRSIPETPETDTGQ